jgi:hypothetical protein
VRHGRVRRRRRSQVRAHPGRPQTPITGPNVVWSVDFKGQFRLGNGHYSYPLTVQDAYAHYLLACDGPPAPAHPAKCFSGSSARMGARVHPLRITYPEHFEVRRVSTKGVQSLDQALGERLAHPGGLPVGLEPLTSGTWNVYFGPVHLGWLDERDYRIHNRRGRTERERHLLPIR